MSVLACVCVPLTLPSSSAISHLVVGGASLDYDEISRAQWADFLKSVGGVQPTAYGLHVSKVAIRVAQYKMVNLFKTCILGGGWGWVFFCQIDR